MKKPFAPLFVSIALAASFPDALVFAELPHDSFHRSARVFSVAEPATLVLFGVALMGIAVLRRRTSRARK